jgi:hypothetical protein
LDLYPYIKTLAEKMAAIDPELHARSWMMDAARA